MEERTFVTEWKGMNIFFFFKYTLNTFNKQLYGIKYGERYT